MALNNGRDGQPHWRRNGASIEEEEEKEVVVVVVMVVMLVVVVAKAKEKAPSRRRRTDREIVRRESVRMGKDKRKVNALDL